MRTCYILAFFILLLCALPLSVRADDVHLIPEDKGKAVFFIYHHIGEDQYSESNLQIEKFKEHVLELQDDAYHVMPIPKIITALDKGQTLSHHTIGLSFEGAYRSTFENAVPLLLEAKLPFTIFVAPERIDRQADYYMTWKELKTLSKNKLVTIGALPYAYDHLVKLDENAQKQQISRSLDRFREELPNVPVLFSWPYGEYTPPLKKLLPDYGFTAAFAQHSGVASYGADMMALPRFSMTDQYGGLDRFRLAAHSFPFPVSEESPVSMIRAKEDTALTIRFQLPEALEKKTPSCFVSGLGKVETEKSEANIYSIQLTDLLFEERVRMNCTLPLLSAEDAKQSEQKWRWYGRLFTQEQEQDTESPAEE